MKLYYSPFSCSLAVEIACREAGLELTLQRADLSTKRIEGGGTLFDLNPLGQVPVLVTDEGHTLFEAGMVLTYVADLAPETRLAPPATAFERYDLHRWLNFVATEVHKRGLHPLFNGTPPDVVKEYGREGMAHALSALSSHLSTRTTLLGDTFTVADAYLFWALSIAPYGQVSLEPFPVLREYYRRILQRPAVQAALQFNRTEYERPFSA